MLNLSELLTPSSSVGDIQRPREAGPQWRNVDRAWLIRYSLTSGADSNVSYRYRCECNNINKRKYP
jgi:hypothetical protein